MDLYYFRGAKSCVLIWTFFVIVTLFVFWTHQQEKDHVDLVLTKRKINLSVNKRLPDIIIVGVKKSGTMTLGKKYPKKEKENRDQDKS